MNVELSDETISIRTYREGDADVLYEAVRESIAEVSPWLPWCHEDYSIEESREFVSTRGKSAADGEWYSFGVFEKDSGKFLGGVGLNFINRVHLMANLGYWVRSNSVGRGVATSATRLAARFGFEELGLHRIEIVAAVENIASQRVAGKGRRRARRSPPQASLDSRRVAGCGVVLARAGRLVKVAQASCGFFSNRAPQTSAQKCR